MTRGVGCQPVSGGLFGIVMNSGLHEILQTHATDQTELGFQPVDVFLFAFQNLLEEFSGDEVAL